MASPNRCTEAIASGGGLRFRPTTFVRSLLFSLTLLSSPAAAEESPEAAGGSPAEASEDDETTGSEQSESESSGESGEYDWDDGEDLFDVDDSSEEGPDRGERREAGVRRRSELRLDELSVSEAREAGFEFGDETETGGGGSSVILAATAGTLVHGVGHWYGEDPRTATFLAGTEGVSAALIGTGLATWFVEGDTPAGAAVASKTFHLGAGLFGFSYLLDVVGSIRSGDVESAGTEERLRGLDLRAAYRFLRARGYPLNHHFTGGAEFDFGRVFGRAFTEQEFALDSSMYGAEVGVRWFRGARRQTFAYAEGSVDFLDFRETGSFERWRGDLRLGLSLDLGLVSPHLEGVSLGAELGYGRSWYTFDVPSDGSAADLQAQSIPLEVYSTFGLGERVRARVAYEQAPERRLQATRRLAGIGRAEIVYDSTDLFDLEIGAEFGGGFSFSGGFLIHVW